MEARPAAVVTPEAVPLDLETASIGSRFLALLIDWGIQAVLLFVLLVIAGNGSFGWLGTTIVLLLVFLVIWGYPVAMETLWRSLAGQIDAQRHREVAERMTIQARDAKEWADRIAAYFQAINRLPLPDPEPSKR